MGAIFTLLRRSLKAAWRRRWLGVAIAWVICLAGWAGISKVPNQYQASARLYIDTNAVLTPLLKNLAVDSSPDAQLRVLQRYTGQPPQHPDADLQDGPRLHRDGSGAARRTGYQVDDRHLSEI